MNNEWAKVNETPDFIGKWQVNRWGLNKFCIEETDGPGHAFVVRKGLDGQDAYELALEHNRLVLRG